MHISTAASIRFLVAVVLLYRLFSADIAAAAIACYQCHGSSSPADYRPVDSSYRNITTGGFVGNHRTHMGEAATPSSCAVCHPGSAGYTSSHRDGWIKVSSRANSSPLVTRYNNSTSAFPQTATPITGSCANVNCHFETTTPAWGSAPYNSTGNCNQCHDGAASLTATHATHKRYSTGLMGKFSTYAACASCHVNYASPPSFRHATSAGKRPINVTVGGYNSGSTTYLPSQTHGAFGTCGNLYCHSPGTKAAAPFTAPNQTATWGGSLTCKGCHKSDYASTDPILSGSHRGHIKSNFDPFVYNLMTCVKCHATTATASLTISDPSRHVNGQIEIAFNNTSSAAGGYYKGTLAVPASPMTKTPGSAAGSCTTVYCHSSGQGANGSWPPTYQTPTWGNSASGYCGTCHGDQFSHGGFSLGNPLTTGSHTKHLQYQMGLTYSDYVRCVACHAYTRTGLAPAGCNMNLCHPPTYKNHSNYAIDVNIPDYFGATAAYNGTTKPGDGYSTCSTVYCHSNGTSVATGTVPANTSPAWGSGAMACDGCHGNKSYSDSRKAFPLYTTGKPKANSHKAHISIGCNKCHLNTTSDGVSITNTANHVNKAYNVNAGGGATFTYTYNASGGSCSSISCHFNNSAQWGTTIACGGCHAVTAATLAGRGHFTHLSSSIGPRSNCNACHGTGATTGEHAGHGSGTINFADGNPLSSTTSCNTCHSPGGTYDGVGNATYGARANWILGVYSSGVLKGGKEKWCASCHDESPSVISGVTAPNVAGNESGAYTYGTGWGYYKTGHGLPITSTFAASGGLTYGAGKECASCHDFSTSHVDGNARTYSAAANNYQAGYRLKSVNGKKPMNMPRPNSIPLVADDFRLCFSCHDANKYLLQSPSLVTTSFRDDRGDPPSSGDTPPINAHNHHLDNMGLRFDSDWDGSYDSQISCVNCHNVHGSTRIAMINDGKLVNREPGLQMYYAKDGVTTYGPPNPPSEPNNPVTLDQSDGTVWSGISGDNICSDCHGGYYGKYYRTPPAAPQAPVLSWSGESGYTTDGVEPNSATGGSYYSFRVKYSDANYQLPRPIQVWVDENDNGTYESNEKYDMQEADPADINCADGKLYRKTLKINSAGDGVLKYRFYASDGKFDAIGSPTSDSTLTATNNAPVLSWTGETGYEADGVNPNSASGGASFTFRVKYTDMDNNPRSSMQVWIDENDNGIYEAGEKFEMTEVDPGDTTSNDGKLYTFTRAITYAGDGTIKYRFYASDGLLDATGTPTTDRTLTVTASNSAPVLSWTGETNYVRDGVNPDTDTGGSSFTFQVRYTDADNNPPSVMQVWVDENNNGIYEAGEKYDMTAVDAGDIDYTDGKLFTRTLPLAASGNGLLNYRFHASDGSANATGTPTEDSFVTVLAGAITVSCSGGKNYTTIQAAINAASSGDTILVSDCTYTEKVTVDAKSVTIKSVNGAATTIIDGGGSGGAVVKFQNGANATLNGFTVRNGAGGSAGGGVYISSSSPAITNSVITANDADNGAGIYLTGSSTVTIANSTVSNNITSALEGGGLYLGSGGSAVISGSTFSNNQGRYSGGIFMTTSANASLSISDSVFSGNRGTLSGGAIYVTASGGTLPLTITNTTFSNNDANDNGGAILISTGSAAATLTITGSTFTGNNTTAQGSALDGGAIYLSSVSSTIISGSTFTNNTGRSGGALYVSNSGANSLSITDSVINSNSASALQGGGLYISGGAAGTYSATIERTTIAGNQADDNGGGAYLTGSVAATFTNCMITGNKAVTLDGGGLHLTGATIAPAIINSTIAGNHANDQGGGIYNLGGSAFELKNSILWNNRDYADYPDIAGPANVSYSDVWQPGFSGSGNISADPLFVNPVDSSLAPTTSGNHHLLIDSPAMDTGTTTGAPANDIDGNVRPIGAGIDMGADEIVTVVNNAPILIWTGEPNYTADGVNPNSDASGASFEFRVNYADSDNNAPSVIQVWVDINGNGVYEAGEKYAMTAVDAGDTNYTDGKLYTKTLNLSYAGNGALKYRFYAADGYSQASGQPTADNTVVINTAPTLSWIGSGNFVSDGVHPNSATSGNSFEFRIKYTDADNNPPTSIQVWVDKNDNGVYEADEKYTMVAVDSGDTLYTDGKDYTRTITLTRAGDGLLNYRFYASDGSVATGAPTSNSTVTVTNNIPTLAWTGETNYTTDGVDPNVAIAGSSFTFRVKYTDADNEAPTVYQVWVDANNNGTYEEGEKYAMTAVDAGDTTYTDGKLYTKTLTLNTSGSIKYKFVFNDGSDAATGAPASDSTVSVTGSNTPPVLDWTGETDYTTDGVNPDSHAGGTNFTFRVKYTDAENTAPTSIQVWVDKNDNASYEEGEKYNMTAVDAGDTTYSDGKLYTATVNIPYAGDGVLNYRFYAHDGTDPATGNATADKTVTVVNPRTVCASGCGYTTIAAAITASASGDYILVSDGTYSEKISYGGKNLTIVSINGAGSTKIQGDGTNNPVVTFSSGETSSAVLDGFTIDNQAAASTLTRGIYISNNSEPSIKNCIVQGNNVTTGSVDGGGIYINGGGATIQNTTVGGSGNANSARYGSGIYATTSSKTITISDSSINYNSGTYGTGIYLTGITTTTIITNTSISNNTSTQSAGGIYSNNSAISLTNCTVNSNATGSTSSYDGGGIYLNGASASATISGGTINSNSGRNGGGIYILNSTAAVPLSINNATISSNTGNVGGGIYISGVTNASVISNTSISNNVTNNASGHGGGIRSDSPISLTNCTINSNTPAGATADGGGVYLSGGTSTITGGSISSNSGRNGAGVYMGAGVTLSITGTTINGNTDVAGGNGGGIYAAGASLTIAEANIKGNRGGYDGGGIYANTTNVTLTNNVISGNTTDQQTTNSDGGGVYIAGGTVNIYNNTIAGNYASSTGGGLKVNAGTVTVRNSIIHSNTSGGAGPQVSGASWPTTTYTDIQGGCASCLDKTGNIDATPQFISLQQAGNGAPTTAGNYHLCYANGVPDAACTTLSPCIDTASATNAPTDDIDGNTRPYDVSGIGDGVDDYDMGADEYVP